MSLIDPPADKPDRSRAMAFTIAALVLVAIVALWYTFATTPKRKRRNILQMPWSPTTPLRPINSGSLARAIR